MFHFEVVRSSRDSLRIPRKKLDDVARAATRVFGIKTPLVVNIVLEGDAKLRNLNKTYRKKDYLPDVLTFTYDQEERSGEKAVLGELILTPRLIKEQAKEHGNSLTEEFTILVIHGIVHLMGYEHEGVSQAKAAKMRELEKSLFTKVYKTSKYNASQ